MAISIATPPPTVHAAFNPVRVEFTKSDSDDIEGEVVLSIQGLALTRHFMGNTVAFYVDNALRTLFREHTSNIAGGYVAADALLAVRYNMQVVSPQVTDMLSRWALNAAAQVGESIDFARYAGKFLTKARYLQKYDGYPLSVAALTFGLGGGSKSTYVFHNNRRVADNGIYAYAHFVISVPDGVHSVAVSTSVSIDNLLETNSWELITTNGGQTIELFDVDEAAICRLQVVGECTPVSPFYVKWVNSMGGYDYLMFKRRQKVKQELKNVQVSEPFVPDVSAADLSEEVYSYDVSNSVIAGAENINAYEFEVLRGLLASPRIWWYREDLQKWIRIYLAKGGTQEDTWQTMHSVEYEFTLPKQNVQI
ncbi:MAG: hypothetical protein LBF55_04010 [Prevotellaceae bacterium]|jgi:hypothetical protein|nr:hypothetical protein [Prevotellaceae bacterium]